MLEAAQNPPPFAGGGGFVGVCAADFLHEGAFSCLYIILPEIYLRTYKITVDFPDILCYTIMRKISFKIFSKGRIIVMQMLLIVLNKTEKLGSLLDAWMEQGIGGATVLKSSGMVRILAKNIEQYPIVGSLRRLLGDMEERKDSRTIFMALQDDKIEEAKAIVRSVVGDLSQPDTAVMFTLPVLSVEGVDLH